MYVGLRFLDDLIYYRYSPMIYMVFERIAEGFFVLFFFYCNFIIFIFLCGICYIYNIYIMISSIKKYLIDFRYYLLLRIKNKINQGK